MNVNYDISVLTMTHRNAYVQSSSPSPCWDFFQWTRKDDKQKSLQVIDHWRFVTIWIIGGTLLEEVIRGFEVVGYQNIDSRGFQEDKITYEGLVSLCFWTRFNEACGSPTIFLRHFKICNTFIFSWKIKQVADERQWFGARREWQTTRIITTTNVEFPQQISQR